MASIKWNHSTILFKGTDGQDSIIASFTNNLANKSRISFHKLNGQEHITASDVFSDLHELYEKLAPEEQKTNQVAVTLILALLVRELSHTSKPVRMLELGCGDGVISCLLGTLLGKYSPESSLFCMSDIIEPGWLDKIALVDDPPKVSYIASDYDFTNLNEHSFDFVVLNGSTFFTSPNDVIKEALRVLRPDGILISYVNDAPLLDSLLRFYFAKQERYELSPVKFVQLVRARDLWWEDKGKTPFLSKVPKLFQKIDESLDDEALFEEHYREYIRELDTYYDAAVEQYDLDHKKILIAVKADILDVILSKEHGHRAFYAGSLREKLRNASAQ